MNRARIRRNKKINIPKGWSVDRLFLAVSFVYQMVQQRNSHALMRSAEGGVLTTSEYEYDGFTLDSIKIRYFL